jgi:hypothetical protein
MRRIALLLFLLASDPVRAQGGLDDLKAAGGEVGLLDRLELGTATGKPRARRFVIDVKIGANMDGATALLIRLRASAN